MLLLLLRFLWLLVVLGSSFLPHLLRHLVLNELVSYSHPRYEAV